MSPRKSPKPSAQQERLQKTRDKLKRDLAHQKTSSRRRYVTTPRKKRVRRVALQVRTTPVERVSIQRFADRWGVTASDLVRIALTEMASRKGPPRWFQKALTLTKCGTPPLATRRR